ncbi:hypothetical protein P280DRAFT_460500 [Massarina eburnea CBS 473.64]|uniref:Transcription initiation factor TFIID subunit 2 n=1 Tax=Massarina eburnea CBS 473.64 TaxID=1395130 RepID=A0A6A6RPP6_9PLEO|nr:hypothetical protein P280DRAFT_460500 [Massarina eburnea CBS 473.64]
MDDPADDPTAATVFTVLHQTVDLDFSFCPRAVEGKTTLEIQPQSQKLSEIQLHSRQLRITRVTVGGREASFEYNNLYDRLSLYPGTSIEQFHFPRDRLQRHEDHLVKELVIFVPDKTRIKEVRLPGAQDTSFESLEVVIEYVLKDFRDAVYFAGVEDGDSRYPHAYTRSSPFPGTASALFPCIDDGSTRGTFDVSVRYPRTVADALQKKPAPAQTADNSPKADSVMSGCDDGDDLTEEEKALEMAVICSGLLTDDIVDPKDPTRMTASFAIETSTGILPQHLGIVIGPFQHVDLSDFRDTAEDDRLQDEAIKVHAFCLPGKEDEVRNSAMVIPRTLDNFTDKYQTYRFGKSYKMVFVDDLDCDTAHTMSLTICSSRLLFPETVWEPLEHTTRVLIHAVASQWIGVDVIAQELTDYWVIVGGSWFMTEFYLRDLFGRNDNRFRQKLRMDKVIQMDMRRPSLWDLGKFLQLDPGEREFMEVKSLSVLSVLHNRLVKASGKNGVDRCLYRLLFQSGNGQLTNGAISTEAFLNICEKVGHQKLENFFKQWVYGSGCPTFECTPSFNKKKQVVQLLIKQTQADPIILQEDRSLASTEFLREAKERNHGFTPDSDWPAFVGPMTIRIHEADGTPYEHIVDINSSLVKVEIPYNTKYKRLKRNRLNKERQAAAQGLDTGGEAQEDVTFYSLGDLFQTPEEMEEWRIEEWSVEDEQKMDNEAYEWIRIDADFEWICKTNINDMPSYMYVSQLQQDKDVVAQVESIQYLARKQAHGLLSSILVKTLMDNRYFHGIRTMAANVLPSNATEERGMVGLFHLKKAFRELFCLPNSPMTRANNFQDRAMYLIQCAIPKAIARIKGPDGEPPAEVRSFLLDVMRYNDNRGNEYSDDFYLATLMRCLTECITKPKLDVDSAFGLEGELKRQEDFRKTASDELQRHLRLDEWIPTYQNIYTVTVLECEAQLIRNRVNPFRIAGFLQYTQPGNAHNVRLTAWACLVELGIFNTNPSVVQYMIREIESDPSPYVRAKLLRSFGNAIGQIAVGDVFTLDNPAEKTGGLVLEEETGVTDRAAELARRKLDGAISGLIKDMASNRALRESLEHALLAGTMSLRDTSELTDIASLVVAPVNKLPVRLKYPRYWKVERAKRNEEGHLWLRFYHSGRVRTQASRPLQQAVLPPASAPPVPIPPPAPTAPRPALKLKLGGKLNVPIVNNPPPEQPTLPAPVVAETPAVPQDLSLRVGSVAMEGGSRPPQQTKPPVQPSISISSKIKTKTKTLTAPVQSPVPPAKVPTVRPTPSPRPSPASLPPTQTSNLKEGVESTASTPRSAPTLPISRPSPAPIVTSKVSSRAPSTASESTTTPLPTPKPKQSISLKLNSKKPSTPKAASALTSMPTHRIHKKKRSKIVRLKIAPEKLAAIRDREIKNGVKRKANGGLAAEQRPTKRQSMEPTAAANGAAGNGLVTKEKVGGRFLVKMKFGKGKLRAE